MKKFILIQTTYPKILQAKSLAKILLQKKLAACIDFAEIKSSYIWEGKITDADEILVTIKTKKSLYKQVENLIRKNHPYQVPQIISTQIDQGSKAYLSWMNCCLVK
jgi:periplasmic divalent cation tolerance protein